MPCYPLQFIKLSSSFFNWSKYEYDYFLKNSKWERVTNNQGRTILWEVYGFLPLFHFLSVSLYVLFYVTLMKPQSRTIIISDITPLIFNQLNLEHAETLSCPCSTISMPYKTFVSNTITFHPVCSSIFVSQQWIQALYLPNARVYPPLDFRATASSQVNQHWLLKKLCSA